MLTCFRSQLIDRNQTSKMIAYFIYDAVKKIECDWWHHQTVNEANNFLPFFDDLTLIRMRFNAYFIWIILLSKSVPSVKKAILDGRCQLSYGLRVYPKPILCNVCIEPCQGY